MDNTNTMERGVFIVGMARAGTTLAQSIIGSHPAIHTFPETHLFDRLYALPRWLRSLLRLRPEQTEQAIEFIRKAGMPEELMADLILHRRNKKAFVRAALDQFDNWTILMGCDRWIEKTPINLRYINTVMQFRPNAQFVHVVREPIENVAVLREVSLKHPQIFQQQELGKAADRCIRDLKETARFLKVPHHTFVSYEQLCNVPIQVAESHWKLRELSPYQPNESHFRETGNVIRTNDEVWKSELRINTKAFKSRRSIIAC